MLPQLIQDSLHNMVVRASDFSSMDGHVTLISRIAAIHVVYKATSESIHWFGQLTSQNPGILAGLVKLAQQTAGQDEHMVKFSASFKTMINIRIYMCVARCSTCTQ